jgi:hypothetical protein
MEIGMKSGKGILSVLLICLFFVNASLLSSKTKIIAVLIVVDQYEDAGANDIASSVRKDYSTLSQFFTLLENRNLYTVEKITLKGPTTRLADINKALAGIHSTKEDIVFVYFSGHGGMDSKGTFLVCADEGLLYRKQVEALLAKKPGKFNVLVTDACSNNVEETVVMKSFSNTRAAKEGKNDAAYKKLFDNYKGFMSISASSAGEYAWADDNLGGYFTHYFFKEALIKNPQETWLENFEQSKRKVVNMFNSLSAQQKAQLRKEGVQGQTPIMLSQPLTAAVADKPVVATPDKPKPPAVENKPPKANIRIVNNTKNAITITIDYNTSEQNWSENNTVEQTLTPLTSVELKNECAVYFESGKEEVGYELGEGKYEFAQVNVKEIDLFEEGEETTTEDEEADVETLMAGSWEMDDGKAVSEITFNKAGTYAIKEEDEITETGKWRITDDAEGYANLVLSGKGQNDIEFAISASDDLSLELARIVDGVASKRIYYLSKLEY